MNDDYAKIAQEILEEFTKRYERMHPIKPMERILMVVGNPLETRLIETLRMVKELDRRIIIIADGLAKPFEYPKPAIVKSMADEMDLVIRGMEEQNNESYRQDFIEEKQRKVWLGDRLSRPGKEIYKTRNKIK